MVGLAVWLLCRGSCSFLLPAGRPAQDAGGSAASALTAAVTMAWYKTGREMAEPQ